MLNTLFERRSTLLDNRQSIAIAEVKSVPSPSKCGEKVATPILDIMEKLSHVEAVLWIGARLADALVHSHARGILHLDLKPENILLADDGQPMLLDFNLSIDLRDTVSMELARIGGTLPYMSPEQIEAFRGGKREIDARSDLYSLGVILFELLTKNSPFQRRAGRLENVLNGMVVDRRKDAPFAPQV